MKSLKALDFFHPLSVCKAPKLNEMLPFKNRLVKEKYIFPPKKYSQLHDRAAFFYNGFLFFFLEQDFVLERHFPIAAKTSDSKKQNINFEQKYIKH